MYMFKENPVDAFGWVVDYIQFIDEQNKGDERIEVSLSGVYKEGTAYNLSALDNIKLYIENRMNGREGEVKMDRILNECSNSLTNNTNNTNNIAKSITNNTKDYYESLIYRQMVNSTYGASSITHPTVIPQIKNIVFNHPATIVFWDDGTKTVVKCQNNEEFDPEKGITMAFFKKTHGNKGHYFEEIKKWTKDFNEKKEQEARDFVKAVCESNGIVPNDHNESDDQNEDKLWKIWYRNGTSLRIECFGIMYHSKEDAIEKAKAIFGGHNSTDTISWTVCQQYPFISGSDSEWHYN